MASKKKADLALVLGVGAPKKGAMGMGDEMGEGYGGEFEAAAAEFMPELADDPERMDAFWRAVRACMERE